MIIVHLYHTFFKRYLPVQPPSKFELLINDLHLIIVGGTFLTLGRKQLTGCSQKNVAACDDPQLYVIIQMDRQSDPLY